MGDSACRVQQGVQKRLVEPPRSCDPKKVCYRSSHGIIDAARQAAAPNLARIVVAIDPAASSGEEADETGILVVGRDTQGHGYVLADASGKRQPIEWAKIAIAAYRAHHADRIVAERNNGGAMVEATIRMVDNNLPVTTVWASLSIFGRDGVFPEVLVVSIFEGAHALDLLMKCCSSSIFTVNAKPSPLGALPFA